MIDVIVPFLSTILPPLLLFLRSQFILLTCHHSHVSALFPYSNCTFLELLADAHQQEGIVNEVGLNVAIAWGVCREGRSVIDLQQNWLKVISNHNIETQQLKAHISSIVLRLTRPVLELKVSMSADYGLNDEVLDALP